MFRKENDALRHRSAHKPQGASIALFPPCIGTLCREGLASGWLSDTPTASSMSDHRGDNPLQHLQRGVGAFWQQATQQLQQGAEGIGRTLSRVAQLPSRSLQRQEGLHIQPLFPGVAVCSGSRSCMKVLHEYLLGPVGEPCSLD